MKTLLSIVLLFLAISSSAPIVFAQTQTKQVAQYPTKNIISSKGNVYKVANYKPIDVASFTTSAEDISKARELLKRLDTSPRVFDCARPEETKPTILKDLNQRDTRMFEVTKTAGVNLTLWGPNVKLNRHTRLVQANFWLFKDFMCESYRATRAFVGMTLYITIKETKGSISNLSLKEIQVAVEGGSAKASYQMGFFGLTELIDFKELNDAEASAFDQDNYKKVVAIWHKLKSEVAKTSVVDPVIMQNVIPYNGMSGIEIAMERE